MKIIGIYKITSPHNKIYIGQSIDCLKRKHYYKNLKCKQQTKLYNSIKKYGWDKHYFEIVHQCSKDDLNELEIYYIELFQCFNNDFGLNLTTGGNHPNYSDETKEKMRSMKIGTKHKPETKNKMRISHLGNKYCLGNLHSEATKKKMSDSHKLIDTWWMRGTFGGKNHASKKVIDIETNIIYDTVSEAALNNNLKTSTLSAMLIGQNKNKTNLQYYEKD